MCARDATAKIVGEMVKALGQRWHPNHFVCTCVHVPPLSLCIDTSACSRHPSIDHFFCPSIDYLSLRHVRVIVFLTEYRMRPHPCRRCKRPFSDQFFTHDGLPYCRSCTPSPVRPSCHEQSPFWRWTPMFPIAHVPWVDCLSCFEYLFLCVMVCAPQPAGASPKPPRRNTANARKGKNKVLVPRKDANRKVSLS